MHTAPSGSTQQGTHAPNSALALTQGIDTFPGPTVSTTLTQEGLEVTLSVRFDLVASGLGLPADSQQALPGSTPDEERQAMTLALSTASRAQLSRAHQELLACLAETALRLHRGETTSVAQQAAADNGGSL